MPGFPWSAMPPGFPGPGPLGRYFAADVNGDKRADLIMLRRSDARWFPVAGGSGAPIKEPGFAFGEPAPPGWPDDGFYLVADFDGDGKADRAYLNPEGRRGPGCPWGTMEFSASRLAGARLSTATR